eukprot:scaffold71583_cov54-Phaeocystis_antarctica.AAC.5
MCGDGPAMLVLLAVTRVGDRLAWVGVRVREVRARVRAVACAALTSHVDGPRREVDHKVGIDTHRAVRLGHGHAAAVAAPRVAQHQGSMQPLHPQQPRECQGRLWHELL